MTNLFHSIDAAAGRIAVKHPEAWVYSFVFTGIAFSILMFGGIGYVLGMPFHQGIYGSYIGLAFYAYWFSVNLDTLKAVADAQVEEVRNLGSN